MPTIDLQKAFDRDAILRTLWDDPIAEAHARAIPARLCRGDEYLDLQHLEAGVQRAGRSMAPSGGELSRSAVRPATWEKLLAFLQPGLAAAGMVSARK